MAVLVAHDIEISFGVQHVLRGCDLTIDPQDRIGLVGPNGCGKSTLLGILGGITTPDQGEIDTNKRLGILTQEPKIIGDTVGEAMEHAVSWHQKLITDHAAASDNEDMDELTRLQDQLDTLGWNVQHKVDRICSRLCTPPAEAKTANLSGGEQKRVALAQTLLDNPDILLLDEPTNHLDADTIEWLQSFLDGYRGAVILVTHDRYLLETLPTAIIEVEEGRCVTYSNSSYTDYLLARAERRDRLQQTDNRRLRLISQEVKWAARSPAARSTKQKARLQRLDSLRSQTGLAKERDMSLNLRTGFKLGSTILEFSELSKAFGSTKLINDLTLSIAPGDRIGILGPNGCGKTTLLKLVANTLSPDSGTIVRGRRVRIGIMDQQRSGLKDDDTLFEAVGEGSDQVKVGDHYIHVASFLNRFLFNRRDIEKYVGDLSGGERARVLFAKLLLQGANVLLLDEPTNDLDLLTLRVLEEAMIGFDGCALVVTHDRAFMDRACNSILAFEGDGQVTQYADRQQYLSAIRRRKADKKKKRSSHSSTKAPNAPSNTKPLTWKERQEFEALPGQIETLEGEQVRLTAILNDGDTYRDGSQDVTTLAAQLKTVNGKIEQAYEQWAALEAKSKEA